MVWREAEILSKYEEGEWVPCYNCEDGFSYHDCGEDVCCCLDKSPNVECDVCEGKGGWIRVEAEA